MSNEERRRKALSELTTFRVAPEYLELYFYHIFDKDISFLPQSLLKENNKPNKPLINSKTAELVILLGRELLYSLGEDDNE